jgi:hypothetical protein
MDWVKTSGTRARISSLGASTCGACLSWRIGDTITGAGASSLKSMQEAEPMTNFVSYSLSEVVVCG